MTKAIKILDLSGGILAVISLLLVFFTNGDTSKSIRYVKGIILLALSVSTAISLVLKRIYTKSE